MKKENIEIIVAIVGCLIGLSGAGAAIASRWRSSVEKTYAAQRDFQHLRNNQTQMVHNLDQIIREQDRRLDAIDLSLNRIESMLHSLLNHPRRHEDDER